MSEDPRPAIEYDPGKFLRDAQWEIERLKHDIEQLNQYVTNLAGECNGLRVQHAKDVKLIRELGNELGAYHRNYALVSPKIDELLQRASDVVTAEKLRAYDAARVGSLLWDGRRAEKKLITELADSLEEWSTEGGHVESELIQRAREATK